MAERSYQITVERIRPLKWEWTIGGSGVATGCAPTPLVGRLIARLRIRSWKRSERRAEREKRSRERSARTYEVGDCSKPDLRGSERPMTPQEIMAGSARRREGEPRP